FDKLLRNGRSALDRAASQVVDRRPQDALQVVAGVLVEGPVLDRDGRVAQVEGDVLKLRPGAVAAERVDHLIQQMLAGAVVDLRRDEVLLDSGNRARL